MANGPFKKTEAWNLLSALQSGEIKPADFIRVWETKPAPFRSLCEEMIEFFEELEKHLLGTGNSEGLTALVAGNSLPEDIKSLRGYIISQAMAQNPIDAYFAYFRLAAARTINMGKYPEFFEKYMRG